MALKRPTPQEYHKLTLTQQTYYLTAWYLDRCSSDQLFTNGRPSKSFMTIRNYFKYKVNPSKYQVLYDAVSSLKTKRLIGIYDLYKLAEKVQLNIRIDCGNPNTEVTEYPSLLECLSKL